MTILVMSYVRILVTVGLVLQVGYSHCDTIPLTTPSTTTLNDTTLAAITTNTTVPSDGDNSTTTPHATTTTTTTTKTTTTTTTTTNTNPTTTTEGTSVESSTPNITTSTPYTTSTAATNTTTAATTGKPTEAPTTTAATTTTTSVEPTTVATSTSETTTSTTTAPSTTLDRTTSTPTESTTAVVPDPCDKKECHNGSCTVHGEDGVCTCSAGFTGETCEQDIDECAKTDNNTCSPHANCTNTDGSYNCTCNSGWTGNGTACTDIDECAKTDNNTCSPHANCTNTDGSYNCTCNSGWTGNGTACTDIDECAKTDNNTCSPHANCTNTDGSYNCTCNSGWTGNGTACTDIDECAKTDNNTCSPHANCTNTDGSYTCTCNSGWTGNGTACTDIDECAKTDNNTCSPHANCTNTDGSYNCTCNSGWTGNGTACTDIDECAKTDNNTCSPHANCTNTDGSYNCTCNSGWTGNGTACTDIDECAKTDNNTCSPHANCTNTDGSYNCTCNSGWTGNGTACTDIDECLGNPCHVWANCTNSLGSYTCECQSGFTGNGVSCEDVDECKGTETNNCENNNTLSCINIVGHYFCQCELGWKGDNCTEENDLCASDPCSPNATCTYNTSGVTCDCNDDFRGNGTTCFRKVLLEYYESNGSQHIGDDEMIGVYGIPGGLPYNGIVYNNIYVSMNGYVSLGQSFDRKYPTFDEQKKTLAAFPLIAPLWADIETKNGTRQGGLYITTSLNATKINGEFSSPLDTPRYAFMATWKNAVPYPYEENKNAEVADFQLVLLTNGTSTKLMMNYDQEYFTWKLSPGRKVVAGFAIQDDKWQVLAGEDNYTQIYKTETNGIEGRLEFDIQNNNDKLQNELSCYTWLHTINTAILKDALKDQDACPCTISQAARDRRFRNEGGHVYTSRFTKAQDSRQMCRYSTTGFLMTGVPDGGYTDVPALNTDDGYSKCCVLSARLCIQFYQTLPSNTCQDYKPPSWSLTWGDPHLNTSDGLNYTFNGRGEYTLIQFEDNNAIAKSTEVQVRTEFVNENTTDATVFVGLAARVGTGPILELNLNRTNDHLHIYIDGEKEREFNGSNAVNLTYDDFEIFNDEGHLIVALSSGITVLVKPSTILDITTNVPRNVTTKGLLGNNDGDPDNDFVARGGKKYPKSSNESEIYEMASTWRVTNNTSLFNYTIIGHEYEFYNNETIPAPTFLSETNMTDYLVTTCGEEIDTSACNEDMACIVDTTLTCDPKFGQNTKQTADDANNQIVILEHLPPALTPDAPDIYLGVKFNTTAAIDIGSLFNDINLNIEMNISYFMKNHSSYENGSFVLNASILSRNGSKPFFVKFEAMDSMNASTEYWPNIFFCGCEAEHECDYTQSTEFTGVSDRFHVATCNCSNDHTGQFCEKRNCNCYHVINATTCDCGCPEGMESINSEGKCYDVDECNQNICSQTCHNTIGSYYCNCTDGYTLNTDGRTCDDINECDQPSNCAKKGQYCRNTRGSYECMCRPGYVKNTDGQCTEVASSFAGVLVLTLEQTRKPEDINDFVRRWVISIFNSTLSNPYVEVKVVEVNASRHKREDVKKSWYRCEFVLHFNHTESTKTVNGYFEDFITRYKDGLTGFEKVSIRIRANESKLYSDEDDGICNIPDKTDCDPVSTSCKTANGTFRCDCKSGFERIPMSSNRCEDIDECSNTSICSKPNGNCINIPGSFDCTCIPGFIFDDTIGCTDMCKPNPCNNGGDCEHGEKEGLFVCKCDDKWTGSKCETENSELSRLRTIAIAVGASVGCVCILLLFVMIGMYRRNKARRMGYSRRPISAFDDFSLTRSSPFTKTSLPLDDGDGGLQGDESTFTIPRPMVRSSEYCSIDDTPTKTTVYDGYAGEEADNQPLTTSKAAGNDDDKRGVSNASFLHRDESKPQRTSKNPYEYF